MTLGDGWLLVIGDWRGRGAELDSHAIGENHALETLSRLASSWAGLFWDPLRSV